MIPWAKTRGSGDRVRPYSIEGEHLRQLLPRARGARYVPTKPQADLSCLLILRPVLETEVRIFGQSHRIRLACIRMESADIRRAQSQAGRKQRASVHQFHAGFTSGLAESHIQSCQRQSGSKRQI